MMARWLLQEGDTDIPLARAQSDDHTSCKGGWEMWSSPVPRRKRRWVSW